MSEGKAPSRARTEIVRGVRDLLPSESGLWTYVEQTAQQVFWSFGFSEIRLPIVERASLFQRAVGPDTDVSKEMFNWVDDPDFAIAIASLRRVMRQTGTIPAIEGSASREKLITLARSGAFNNLDERIRICLRPEATASVCRAYIEHNMQQLPQPVKLYYMGPMFRRERPQKGRYRQFYQIGAEVLEAVRPDAAKRDPTRELRQKMLSSMPKSSKW